MAGPPSSGSGKPSDTSPATPEPAMVMIVPYAMRRTRLLASTTRMPPAASVATPVGPLSCASVAGPPSPRYPATPRPATRLIVASTNVDDAARVARRPAVAALLCTMDILVAPFGCCGLIRLSSRLDAEIATVHPASDRFPPPPPADVLEHARFRPQRAHSC